jgi:hypothetical protein
MTGPIWITDCNSWDGVIDPSGAPVPREVAVAEFVKQGHDRDDVEAALRPQMFVLADGEDAPADTEPPYVRRVSNVHDVVGGGVYVAERPEGAIDGWIIE